MPEPKHPANEMEDTLYSIANAVLDEMLRANNGAEQGLTASRVRQQARGLTFEQRERAVRLVAARRPGVTTTYWHPCPDCNEERAARVPCNIESEMDRRCDSCGEIFEVGPEYAYAVVVASDPSTMLYTLRNEASRLSKRLAKYGHPEHATTLTKVSDALTVLAKAQ